MNIVDTFDNPAGYIKVTDLDNFFNVYQDKKGYYFFNLNSTIYITIPTDLLETMTLTYDCHWPLISYLLYNTPRLAWLLMKINNVKADKIFDIKYAGDKILYPSQDQLQVILNYLNSFDVNY